MLHGKGFGISDYFADYEEFFDNVLNFLIFEPSMIPTLKTSAPQTSNSQK